jgi:UDP-N-acetylglucosamine--N-acetylmuramyl-(pentapeptide) pyrophosphoryl-undecaprenol N-acetylglucosamine transferase
MKILFCAGGTFGHIAPALAAAEALKKRKPKAEILFAGRENGTEGEAARKAGFAFYGLPMQSIERKFNLQALRAILTTAKAYARARMLLKKMRPDLVFGTGGYVCYPFLRAAQELKIPTVLHESNATPGRACRMLAPKCKAVLLGTRACEKSLPRNIHCHFTGNPVREEFFLYSKEKARCILGLKKEDSFILSFGGSGGAERLNEAILSLMAKKDKEHAGIYHIQAAGKKYYADIAARYPAFIARESKKRIFPFIENMPLYMRAADLCICRSGAMTIAELAAAELPAILIPSPNVTEDHQYKNAKSLADMEGAVLLKESDLDQLGKTARLILSDKAQLERMRAALGKYAAPKAAERIAEILEKFLP